MIFLPFQGTFFLIRGVKGGSLGNGLSLPLMGVAGGFACPLPSFSMADLVSLSITSQSFCEEMDGLEPSMGCSMANVASTAFVFDILINEGLGESLALNVSLLDLGWRRCEFSCEFGETALAAFGVRRSWSWSQPLSEPLNEECSLLPSLNQCRGSALLSPAVWVRIQSSVNPPTCRRTLFARTAAAALTVGCGSASDSGIGCGCDEGAPGGGRRNGVLISKWWMGNSSDPSLLKLCRRKLTSVRGYGDPQLAVPNWSSSSRPGDVLKSAEARSGSRGAGRGGRVGDASKSSSPSAVEAVDSAGELGDGDSD